ncbi:MAG: choice-of-anchor L domain-containing protein [Saprospirales bacterium]|nr:choice-of-anchor L domain-containing protein [Saprospirales bacterium]
MRGTFANGMSSIGIATGVILSSGNIATATGPNNSASAGTSYGSKPGRSGPGPNDRRHDFRRLQDRVRF